MALGTYPNERPLGTAPGGEQDEHDEHGHGGFRHGLRPAHLPPATAALEELPDGARITFRPIDPADLEALRSKLEERASRLMAGRDDAVRR
jgi:hypothetical protein